MFRKMRRSKQELTSEENIELLKVLRRGTLAVHGDDGYPYCVPVNFFYDPDDHAIYIHGAKEGHKIDAIARDDKVCFSAWNDGIRLDGDWAYTVESVVVFGRAELVKDPQILQEKLRLLGLKYYPTAEEVDNVMERTRNRVEMICIRPEHITGKRVHEK